MKKFLRKRGADTNQNIFYLVIAVIVLAAAAFGLDQAFRAMNRSDARQAAAAVSSQVRGLYANVGILPSGTGGLSAATVLSADILPSNIVNRDTAGVATAIVLPNSGEVSAIAPTAVGSRDFRVTYRWPAASGRARGICNSLVSGAGTGRVESGPLGLDYTLVTAGTDCLAAAAAIQVDYHR